MDVRHGPSRRIGPPANEVNVWRKTLWICCLLLLGVLITVAEEPAKSRGTDNPLSPMDLSSPRTTLNTFFERADEIAHLARDEYWYSPSQALSQRIADQQAEMSRMFDLSGISPAAALRWPWPRRVPSKTSSAA